MHSSLRRTVIGAVAGLIAGIALAPTLHNLPLAFLLAMALGALYGFAFRPTRLAFAESTFTAAALALPAWCLFSVVILPALAGEPPGWDAEGMHSTFPQFAGWIIYGAALGLITQALNDGAQRFMGAEPAPAPAAAAPPATRIVILGGGFAGMTTAENLESEFAADPSVTFTLVSDANALLFTPMLAEVAGSSLEPSHISTPLRTSLHRTSVVRGHVTHVDLERRCVRAASPTAAKTRRLLTITWCSHWAPLQIISAMRTFASPRLTSKACSTPFASETTLSTCLSAPTAKPILPSSNNF